MAVRLEIGWRPELHDAEGEALRRKALEYCGLNLDRVRVLRLLMLDMDLTTAELDAVRTEVFTNPVTQVSSFSPLAGDFDWALWVGFKPGVRDNAGATAREAIEAFLGRSLPADAAVYTSKLYLLGASLTRDQVARVARELLANDLIQEFRLFSREEWNPKEGIGLILPRVHLEHQPAVAVFPLDSLDTLRRLSLERHLYLRDQDLPIIQAYFMRPEVLARRGKVGLGPPTDVELEYLAQARSDHCNHNTFRGRFHYRDLSTGESFTLDNPFKVCIEAPTREIVREKPWVVSVLKDNAGVGQFDEDSCFVIKGETHNSPSNLEAYGGSLTGIVGVYRDPMGTGRGSRLIAGMYGFCVGSPGLRRPLKAPPSSPAASGRRHRGGQRRRQQERHPHRRRRPLLRRELPGQMPGVRGGPGPDAHWRWPALPGPAKRPAPATWCSMCGGRVGMDGIHGVTASSEVASRGTPAGHVQIGDPYTQKKMQDFLLEARDLGFINFITDCGGGGLSSAVGESGQQAGGVEVWLEKIPLKYAGLDPWEIWVSESQERMVVGLDPASLTPFADLARRHEVEVSVIGRFTDRGVMEASFDGRPCAFMDLSFLEEEFPAWEFEAEWLPPGMRLTEPVVGEVEDHRDMLLTMLARPNICSREWITRQYDHEVQGASVLKPLTGRACPVPGDAAVLRPKLTGPRGLCVALSLNPAFSQIDAYHMAAVTIDEAVRRLVAVGGDLGHLGGVDNFCWPSVEYHPEKNPDGKFKAAQLVRACQALKDLCLAYGLPLLSGKDSMYVDGVLARALRRNPPGVGSGHPVFHRGGGRSRLDPGGEPGL